MRLNVNPNRMELTKLKQRLNTATRGHKLLKDKQDELIRRFIILVKRNNALRLEMEREILGVYGAFMLVGAEISPPALDAALALPGAAISMETGEGRIMNVAVPKFTVTFPEGTSAPYGFAGTNDELDRSLDKLRGLLPRLMELAEVEKTCVLLTDEIEKTRRRVNALEYMTIPQLQETIKYIKMKLDENERGALIRLMKIKSVIDETG